MTPSRVLLSATTGLRLLRLAAVGLYLSTSTPGQAHEHVRRIPNFGNHTVDWHTDQIVRVMAFGSGSSAEVVTLDGKQCLEGSYFSFDVDDQYAFDIDEPVDLEVEFYKHREAALPEVVYEKNGDAEARLLTPIPAYKGGTRSYKATISLERARFANRGLLLTDFSIGNLLIREKITICGISLRRSHKTPVPAGFGAIVIEVRDETGKPVPVRAGIYDETGRLPLPSDEAVAIRRADELVRVVSISRGLIPWPARNPSGFYINGSYRAKLPAGRYELVVAKGPEYRFSRRAFTVRKDATQTIEIDLQRWADLPARGWYSGDNHVHYIRHDNSDDPNLLLLTQAEDVHVANNLQMGNIATVAWPQYGWRAVRAEADESYVFVPGQEDPRTSRRGHTISLNLTEPIRDPLRYLLYDEVFAKARAQGGVTGYAHVVGAGAFNARAGLALDVPFGLVDFVEVMQFGYAGSSVWFDFLNLGYKLAPSAGTDYMTDLLPGAGTLPGAERSYVRVQQPFSAQKWFDAFKSGNTFVTNGPMLELSVNGQGMGSELRLNGGQRVVIEAAASINPDIDSLQSLELIEQGDVVKTVIARKRGETELRLHHELTARHGTWFVLRARGHQPHEPTHPMKDWEANQGSARIALSGAVYVYVDDQGFWKPSAVPSIVQRHREAMAKLMVPETGDAEETGARQTAVTLWDSQKQLLQQQIDKVAPIYDELLEKARMATSGGSAPIDRSVCRDRRQNARMGTTRR